MVFDLGGVLIDWDPRHLYRKFFSGDEPAMERFLANVCTHEWNRCQDSGRSFAEGARLLKLQHPDKAELINAYGARFDEMMAGPIFGTVEILAELRERGTPLYGLSNFSAERFFDDAAMRVADDAENLLLLANPVLPHSRGEIVLESKDPDTNPAIRMNYYDDPHDMKVMVAAIRRTMEIAAHWPGNRKLGPLMMPPLLAERHGYREGAEISRSISR